MIKFQLQRYRFKDSNKRRRAVYITLLKPVTYGNLKKYQMALKTLLEKQFDYYVIKLKDSSVVTGFTIKLLLAFHNTVSQSVGILLSRDIKWRFSHSLLNTFLVAEENPMSVIIEIEKNRRRIC